MSRSRLEQETTISYNAEEDLAMLWTAQAADQRKWTRLGLSVEPYGGGWRTKCPKAWIRVRPGRTLSETNRQATSDRMKRLREAQLAGQLARV